MGQKSAETHEFRIHPIEDDNSSLYTALRHVNGTSVTSTNKSVRSMVADYIGKNERLSAALSEQCNNVKVYCDQIKKGTMCGGKIEIEALASICKLVIHTLNAREDDQGNMNIKMVTYGYREGISKECVYIYYDEQRKHFDPLCVIDKKNPWEETTLFQYDDDKVVHELLDQFVRRTGHGNNEIIQEEIRHSTEEMNPSTEMNGLGMTTDNDPFDVIALNANTAGPNKRILPSYANFSLGSSAQDFSPPSKKQKRTNYLLAQSDESSESNEDLCQSLTMEEHLQTDFFVNEIEVPTSANDTAPMIRFAYEPTAHFRGRTSSEFKPKKPVNRDGYRSVPAPPRWFPDQHNNRCLILLIPEEFLELDTEHGIEIHLVTREIDGYTYPHPYFKLQVSGTDRTIPDVNPGFISFTQKDLTQYAEGVKQLKLRMVVVMHTNRELMQAEQPLPVFSSNNGGSKITAIYEKHQSFKNAYHLHDLRFVATLMTKKPDESEFQRRDDIQCISQISTEDKSF